ncbi:MAG: uncharacterized protein PWR17_711 [Candidatus Methanomethylophilaceae archaeon]|nr:uncharacterized protein [Candidatus Methanomethylophilaceae archaeon]
MNSSIPMDSECASRLLSGSCREQLTFCGPSSLVHASRRFSTHSASLQMRPQDSPRRAGRRSPAPAVSRHRYREVCILIRNVLRHDSYRRRRLRDAASSCARGRAPDRPGPSRDDPGPRGPVGHRFVGGIEHGALPGGVSTPAYRTCDPSAGIRAFQNNGLTNYTKYSKNGNTHTERPGVDLFQKALCLETGDGCEQNIEEALRIYNQLADEGNLDAIMHLARMYISGMVINADYHKGSEYLQRYLDLTKSNPTS